MPFNSKIPRFSFLATDLPEHELSSIPLDPTKDIYGHPHNGQERGVSPQKAQTWTHSQTDSQINLVPIRPSQSQLRRYLARNLLNVFGPCLLVAIYVSIVVFYLSRPAINQVAPHRPITPRGVFYLWLTLGVFLIDWAKTGAASLEAALLMRPGWAPTNARQLMWHADRSWGTLNGWIRAWRAFSGSGNQGYSDKPSILWTYLCVSSILLYSGIPLAGLSVQSKQYYTQSDRIIVLSGSNQSTFDFRATSDVANSANNRWRQGNPTTPESAGIMYAPEGTHNVSATFFEDAIQGIYQKDLANMTVSDRNVTFFIGPRPSERAYGSAWGLQVSVGCSPVNPLTGLENMHVDSVEDWSGTDIYGTNLSTYFNASTNYSGTSPLFMFFDTASWMTSRYFLAVDKGFEPRAESDYVDNSTLPNRGSIELVMWQTDFATPDQSWLNITKSRYVVNSISHSEDDTVYYGYGIRCEVESSSGGADLDAAARTFSGFQQVPADVGTHNNSNGILAIQSLVFSAFTTASINVVNSAGMPPCNAISQYSTGIGNNCGAWYGANSATNGLVSVQTRDDSTLTIHEPITPERMNLAMYKLFGETAIAMLNGPSGWSAEMKGLDPITDITPGLVPWQLPLTLLTLWALMVVVPSIWTLTERRFASTMGGFEMFRLGAEWKEAAINEANARGPMYFGNATGPDSTSEMQDQFGPPAPRYDPGPSYMPYKSLGREGQNPATFI